MTVRRVTARVVSKKCLKGVIWELDLLTSLEHSPKAFMSDIVSVVIRTVLRNAHAFPSL
jgi:hypothetical protein